MLENIPWEFNVTHAWLIKMIYSCLLIRVLVFFTTLVKVLCDIFSAKKY